MAVPAPAMPLPSSDTLWRTPYLILGLHSLRHAVGWQDSKKDGPCFLVARIGGLGIKVLDRFPLTADGWARAWATLVNLDASAAQLTAESLQERSGAAARRKTELERLTQAYEAFARAKGGTVFELLGVQVLPGDGEVYTIGRHDPAAKTNTSRLLGPLAGSKAVVTDGSQAWSPGRAVFMPIALTALATKTKADAAVVFPDGTVHTTALDGNHAVREAQKQVIQFNALAGAIATTDTENSSGHADRLRTLQELRDAGLLTTEEYEAKRAEIIKSI